MKNVLVIAPHMDDETLGCGGTIKKHVARGDTITVVFVAHRKYNNIYNAQRNDIEMHHAREAQKILGYHNAVFLQLEDEKLDTQVQDIIIKIETLITETCPDIVLYPFSGDNNQDHRAVAHAAQVIFRPAVRKTITEIFMYEVPSSTEQSPPTLENAFMPSYFVNIADQIDAKLEALRCYESEIKHFPHPRSIEGIITLAKSRGMKCGFTHAEAFMTVKRIWDTERI